MKRFLSLSLILIVAFIAMSCDSNVSSDLELARQTELAMKEANRQTGMPAIQNFQQKKLAKMIYELQDKEDLVCYAYTYSEMTGKYHFLGKCIGYGLPYSVQYSNPEKIVRLNGNRWKLPQPEPNGLFMPEGLSATWILLIDSKTGKARPVYVEPTIIVSPFPLERASK